MDILRKTWSSSYSRGLIWQQWLEGKVKNVGKGSYGRVLKMSRKPTSEEYSKALIVTGIGIALVGAIGFAIFLGYKYFPDIVEWAFGL